MKGIGWGTNDDTFKTLEIPVPNNSTQFTIVFSGDGNNPARGIGYLFIKDNSDNTIFSFSDGHASGGITQSIYINGQKQTGTFFNVINKEVVVEIQDATSIFIKMKGYTSSYPYTKRYIKSLLFN